MKSTVHQTTVQIAIAIAIAIQLIGCHQKPPPPPPPPPPTPTIHSLSINTINNPATRTPELAALLIDIPFWESLKKPGDTVRHFDAGNPSAAPLNNALATAGGPPALIITDANNGEVLATRKLQTDRPTISTTVETARHKN